MNKLLIGIALLISVSCCSNDKKKASMEARMDYLIDSISRYTDSVMNSKKELMPVKVDDSFEDFLFSFVSDSVFQEKRVAFPLSVYHNDSLAKISQEEWEHDSLFINQSYYTLIFDNENDMDYESDTITNSVKVERYNLLSHSMKRSYFQRVNGIWLLEGIHYSSISEEAEDKGEDFFDFIAHFVMDDKFQEERIVDPLAFATPDPDDEFSILETSIKPEQWFAFRPYMSKETISNLNFGQPNNSLSENKILFFKGIGNGFANVLHFKKENNKWMLTKFEDISN